MDKRGMGHVEMIISFSLFVAAIIFVVVFFKPMQSESFVDSGVEGIFESLGEEIEVEIEIYGISVIGSEGIIGVEIPGIDLNKNVRIESYSGKRLNSERVRDIVYFARPTSENFVFVKFNEEFDKSTISEGKPTHNPASYSIASSIKKKIVSEKKILELKEQYDSDYSGLKKKLNIPRGIDFGFDVLLNNGNTISAESNSLIKSEVFSGVKRKEIIRANGNIEFADILVKIW